MTIQEMVKVLEVFHVTPSPSSVPQSTTVPLTFLDIYCYTVPPVQRLFLYSLHCSASTFLTSHLPNLKHSLSLALARFHPLAGNIVLPTDGTPPTIHYSTGDSVTLTVAESSDDFDDLVAHHGKQAARFHSLVPALSFPDVTKQQLLSLQVTLFPGRGVGIGICIHHGAADGTASMQFMKTWASISRLGTDVGIDPPVFDRDLIPDPRGLRQLFWDQFKDLDRKDLSKIGSPIAREDTLRATFVLTRAQLEGLRGRLMAKSSKRYSTFTLACAVTWVSLSKARRAEDGSNDGDMLVFAFAANCRSRIDPPVPSRYCGNVLGLCGNVAERRELAGEEAVADASMKIWEMIKGLDGGDVLRHADSWVSMRNGTWIPENILSVAGSPMLRVYEVDLGWGRPRKVEVITTERTGAISLAENGDETEGGVEVGLVLPVDLMERFDVLFRTTLESLLKD